MAVAYVSPYPMYVQMLTTARTGAKCLPASQISQCRGLVLHDCHAEILTIRAFNYWLLNECRDILSLPTGDKTSPYIRHRSKSKNSNDTWPPLELHQDVKIYMYCTCAPCGDASMELCMAAQEDPTPWELPPPPPPPSSNNNDNGTNLDAEADTLLVGRAHFSLLGAVRRKPARTDAESTRSKSCSDKLALRQVLSLLSHETSLLVAPTENVYLAGVVLPEEEISRLGCERAFGATGRMKALNGRRWPASSHTSECPNENDQKYNYTFHPFQILSIPPGQIELLWPFRKPPPLTPSSTSTTATTTTNKKSKPSNLSVIWTLASSHTTPVIDHNPKSMPKLRGSTTGLYETIINGVKQGNKASNPLARGASALSRARLWALVRDIIVDRAQSQGGDDNSNSMSIVLEASTYDEFKDMCTSQDIAGSVVARGQAIRDARQVLKGWVPNSGDGEWGLDVLVDPKKRKRESESENKSNK